MKDDLPTVPGFSWAGMHAGIKDAGKLDLALLVADTAVPTAAVFTRNVVRAAPVDISETRVRAGKARAIIVNSGNANACTGDQGHVDALSMTRAVAEALDEDEELVLVASTGVIGRPMPIDVIEAAVPMLVSSLRFDAMPSFSQAILTTDQGPKVAETSFLVGRKRVRMAAIAKGAGMIHPNMATTLAFVASDAEIKPAALRKILKRATDVSFNAITVDGDTSTNDSLFAMASGAADAGPLDGDEKALAKFEKALTEVLTDVSTMIVADGEGAEHVVRIEVIGTDNDKAARAIAQTMATSNLVKTAFFGRDPNWGRLLAAAGRSGVAFDPSKVELRIGDAVLLRKGQPVGGEAEAQAAKVMALPEYTVRFKVGTGPGRAHYRTSDLGHNYVTLNADYHT